MKMLELWADVGKQLFWLALIWLALLPCPAHGGLEQNFDVLQIGTTTYRNVTVTTKSKNYIFILHSKGMTNVKVADLSPELRSELGYEVPVPPQPKTKVAEAWARQTLTKLDAPQVQQAESKVKQWWEAGPGSKITMPVITPNLLIIAGAVFLALYLFHSYCCLLICRKAGSEPGALVWLPVLQLVPLLKAAGMSPLWFFAFLVPGVNLVAQVLWCVNITRARGKTFWVALFLIFPLTSPLAALYLAFSGGGGSKKSESRRVEIMTLEAA